MNSEHLNSAKKNHLEQEIQSRDTGRQNSEKELKNPKLESQNSGEEPENHLLRKAYFLRKNKLTGTKGRHGSAPMSNWLQRFFFVLEILVGIALTLQDYWILHQHKKTGILDRNPASAWPWGLLFSLVFCLGVALIERLDHWEITTPPYQEKRRKEKKILLYTSLGLLLVPLFGWLFLS